MKVAVIISALAVAAAALPQTTVSQCNTGDLQCCKSRQSVQSSSNPSVASLLGLLGAVVQGAAVQVGLTCSPISVIGVGGNSCTAQPVCCTGNNFNGLVALGCTPVNLSL
ncbi:fungal hydrophobin-domain-containing protein [Cyathus striatus]|nr:fungal hydrophobin-domain-containing protein [Cyathus striatus]